MQRNVPRVLAVALAAGWALVGGNAVAQVRTITSGQAVAGQDQAVTTQTGESTSFAIQRDPTEAVQSASTNFLSPSSTPGSSGTRYGTVEGFGSLSGSGGASTLSSLGLGGRSGLGGSSLGLGTGFGLGNQIGSQFGAGGQTGQQGIGGAASLPLRHRIRVDIATSPRVTTRISRDFSRRLTKLPGLTGVGSVDATMVGQTVVLTGSVDSARTRDLVARLAMLEPGIAAVQNELLVKPNEASPETLQPPSR